MTVTEVLTDGGALVVIVGGLAALSDGAFQLRVHGGITASRQTLEQIWPTRSVAASYRGPGGVSVPAGEYHCPLDNHILDLDYPQARGKCPACGRVYELRFPEFSATWR